MSMFFCRLYLRKFHAVVIFYYDIQQMLETLHFVYVFLMLVNTPAPVKLKVHFFDNVFRIHERILNGWNVIEFYVRCSKDKS